ncbi:hypothetical protein OG21DRAFT_1581023 [Imleria badia]|nr:hypothetical protein OG21DRAFT_1581023 [Imleria badia]
MGKLSKNDGSKLGRYSTKSGRAWENSRISSGMWYLVQMGGYSDPSPEGHVQKGVQLFRVWNGMGKLWQKFQSDGSELGRYTAPSPEGHGKVLKEVWYLVQKGGYSAPSFSKSGRVWENSGRSSGVMVPSAEVRKGVKNSGRGSGMIVPILWR